MSRNLTDLPWDTHFPLVTEFLSSKNLSLRVCLLYIRIMTHALKSDAKFTILVPNIPELISYIFHNFRRTYLKLNFSSAENIITWKHTYSDRYWTYVNCVADSNVWVISLIKHFIRCNVFKQRKIWENTVLFQSLKCSVFNKSNSNLFYACK